MRRKEEEMIYHEKRDHLSDVVLIIASVLLTFFYYGHSNAESFLFKRNVKERLVASIDSSVVIPESFTVSLDGRRVAYVAKVGNKQAAVVDGIQQEPYDEIKIDYFGLLFSPDSTRIGFFVRENNRLFFVIDGKEQREHQPATHHSFHYSEEGSRYCYVAKTLDKNYLVIDGQVGSREYENIWACTFSRDGKRSAYGIRDGKKEFWVVDHVKQKEYGVVGSFTFSPDGKRFAYRAHPDKDWTRRGQRWFMVIDGREEKEYWKLLSLSVFSPDSKRTAYAAEPGTDVSLRPLIVLDGREMKDDFAGFSEPVFSPDGQRIAYMAKVYKKGFMVPIPAPSHDFNVVDGKPGQFYDRTSIPVFSPDSRRFAYYGVLQDKYTMVIDNKEGKRYDHIGHPVFSPDSKHVGFNARQEKINLIAVDGREYNAYEYVSNPVFSPDSQRVCYLATKSGKRTVVVDDVEGPFYDEIYPKGWRVRVAHNGIGFSSDVRFYYFAKRGSELVFVQETLETVKEGTR
jgi:WD40 repeat protein